MLHLVQVHDVVAAQAGQQLLHQLVEVEEYLQLRLLQLQLLIVRCLLFQYIRYFVQLLQLHVSSLLHV